MSDSYPPWENWYHCMCNTYGTWLGGDPRGWRERHHRKHVDGDYKSPPTKGSFEDIYRRSQEAMKRDPVYLQEQLSKIALLSIVESLQSDRIRILIATLDDHHLHVLAQCRDHRPRQHLGWAKLHATKTVKAFLNAHGAAVGLSLELKKGEGIWEKGSECKPIRNRSHRLNVLNYLRDHFHRGALVWLNPKLPRYVPSIG